MHYIRALANNRFIHNKGEEGEGRGGRRNIGDMVRREEGAGGRKNWRRDWEVGGFVITWH